MTGNDFTRMVVESLCDACMTRIEEVMAALAEPDVMALHAVIAQVVLERGCARCRLRQEAMVADALNGKYGYDDEED
jgi:hypothetical protein